MEGSVTLPGPVYLPQVTLYLMLEVEVQDPQ